MNIKDLPTQTNPTGLMDLRICTNHANQDYLTIEEIFEHAKANGIGLISLMDQETLAACFEVREKYSSDFLERTYGIRIIPRNSSKSYGPVMK